MSREFHVVSPEMWSDERFVAINDDAKLLWNRLLTGPEATALPGLIVAGRLALAEAMGWAPKKFDRAFAQLSAPSAGHEHPMAVADWHKRVIWLPQAAKHRRRPKNQNEVLSWRDNWKVVPDCELKRLHAGKLREFLSQFGDSFADAFDSYSVHSRQPNYAEARVPCRGTSSQQEREQPGEQPNDVPARACARARSNSHSPSDSDQGSTYQEGTEPAPAAAPTSRAQPAAPPGGLTSAPDDIELTQSLRDECVMNGWPEPTKEHIVAFLLNAKSKGQLFADWNARFKWWMSEERKRMGRRPFEGPGPSRSGPPSSTPRRAPAVLPELE